MINENVYWIWLQCCIGTDSRRLKTAAELFRSARNMYDATERELRLSGIFTDRELQKLLKKDLDYPEKTLEKCKKLGYEIIHFGDEKYPRRLAEISLPPVLLYVKGELPDDKLDHVGIVGTRNPDESGKKLSYSFGYDLAKDNKVIVSGGAHGIDIYAHKGSIDSGGKTVSVIGCGIDMFENSIAKYLKSSIDGHGAVVSEYPPGYPPRNYTFPTRNRIISGMSDCLLTVQAGLGSGALITVKFALEQNRKVFSVPGSMDNVFCSGTNYMLRCGFSAALCAHDISKWLSTDKNSSPSSQNPVVTKEQLIYLSTKHEEIKNEQRTGATMPSSACYEIINNMISLTADENDISADQLKVNEIYYIREESETDTVTDINKEEGIEEETQDIKNEAIVITDNNNLYTLSPETMSGLFTTSESREPDLSKTQTLKYKSPQTQTAVEPVKNESKPKYTKNAPNSDAKISKNVKKDENKKIFNSEQLTEDTLTVYHTISDTPVFIDTIADSTGFNTSAILSSLTELELYGLIRELPGKRYVRK